MNELKNKRGGKMQIEFQILDALQKIHTPVLDGVMCLITSRHPELAYVSFAVHQFWMA